MSSLQTLQTCLPLQLLTVTLVIFILTATTEIIRHRFRQRRRRLPPGPPAIPIIGNLHQIGELPHRSLWKLSRKYGPLLRVKLGFVPTVVVSSPEAARELLKTHDLHSCSRPALSIARRLSYDYADIGFSPYNDYWREVRKICALELFSVKRVQSFRYIREEEIESLVKTISHHSDSGKPVNLSEKLMSLAVAMMFRAGFGMSSRKIEEDNKRFRGFVDEGNEILRKFSAEDLFPYVGWIVDRVTGLHRRREKCFHDLDEFYEDTIRNHIQNNNQEGREDIVDVMLKIEREQLAVGDKRFTRNHIKAILMDLLVAGIDAPATVLTWGMTELIRNPRVMKKAQTEIRNRIKNEGMVKEEDLEKLEYLRMVTKETLRLHPSGAMLLPRESMSEFKICGYDIDPKTRIEVNVWAIGRDPSAWKDPEEFFPERFIKNEIDVKGQHFELLPFGGGRRSCPGINTGLSLVELGLANLLYCFDWKLPEGMTKDDVDIEEAAGISVQKKVPLQLVPVKTTIWSWGLVQTKVPRPEAKYVISDMDL
ncbi:PREDICTED: cytochrome P450 71B34-like [Tarenaya hassleriana]|uniref:cytochrome P450 71B34-like n=1 Tax=Tarenaya hassleriana TaxID=28532 RepID=UPI00053C7EEA|nr:PREDICTED: cytochrome P450 71B34-like [Tarenaya hassleriana]